MKKRNINSTVFKSVFLVLSVLIVSMVMTACVTLQPASVTRNGQLSDYPYFVINSTETLTSGQGMTSNGIYSSINKTVNPKDVIAGYLIKKGLVVLPESQEGLLPQTLIVNYGESGRRNVGLGYTIEVTIQFISAFSNQVIFLTTAEGIGDTEADDIREAITRAMDALFEE